MLSPQPGHRYQTAEEIVSDLRNFLDGRETTAAAESARASQRTQVIPRDAMSRHAAGPDTAPTDPVPVAAGAAAAPRRKGSVAGALGFLRARRWSAGVLVRVVLAAFFIMFVLSAGAGWSRAERFRQGIGALQPADVPAVRIELENIRRQSMFGVPRSVRQALQEHLVSLAERAIMDFRNDLPVTELQWRQARTCLALATEIAPNARSVAAKARYVDGQLARIAAQGQSAAARLARLNEAKSRFIESARLDTSSPDPYLGQARINAYEARDFEALLVNISEAEQRGYKPGRRERAQVGDGFKFKADRALTQSRGASGVGRRRFLEQAASDFESCVSRFEALANYFGSDRNLAYCQRQLERVKAEIEELEGKWTFPGGADADRQH
jgi:hypothetical protein